MRRRGTLVLALICLLAAAPAARADAPASWGPLAERIAAPWPGLQNDDGTYQDYVYGGDVSHCLVRRCREPFGNARYAESVNGYALLLTGVRTGDNKLIDTALRSLTWVARHPEYRDTLQTNFETWALSSAYNLARARIPNRKLFRENRAHWERWLKTVKPLLLRPNARRYFNHHLVEAVATLELRRTGLRSKTKGAVLNPKVYPGVEKLAVRTVEQEVYAVAKPTLLTSGGAVAAIVSDRPEYPLAYQGLSIGFYARALESMGPKLSGRARELLTRMLHASWLLTGPDGDLAYTGRSQEESWALPMTAYGAQVAARLRGVSRTRGARWHALADRAIERLGRDYAVGPKGLWIVPALERDPERGLNGIDDYAGAAIFSGLTLAFLEYALADAEATRKRAVGALAADADGAWRLGRGDDSFVTVRRGSLWYAVRQSRDMQRRRDDLRSDFGLVVLKRRVDGRWRDAIPVRPKVYTADRTASDSAGPLLLRPSGDGSFGVPVGTRISAGTDGSVRVTTGWRMPDGTTAREGTVLRYQPVECGVRLRVPVAAGDSVQYDVMAGRAPDGVKVDGPRISDGTQTVTFSEPPSGVRMLPGYASGSHPEITRVRATFPAGAARTLIIDTCTP